MRLAMPFELMQNGRVTGSMHDLAGWRNCVTGEWWPLPHGHKPPEYQSDPLWQPIFHPAPPSDVEEERPWTNQSSDGLESPSGVEGDGA